MLRECHRCSQMLTVSNMATFTDYEVNYYCHPVMQVNEDTCFILSQRERMEQHRNPLHTVVVKEGEQDLPTITDGVFIQDEVKEYIDRRKEHGIKTYGTALQAFNGRDALRDAYEEAIDLVMYLAQMLVERDGGLPR